jgi:uncharacterized membrane protein YfcA
MLEEILLYVIIGFVAQMVDGAIGMAYGLTATSVLLSIGVSPATASASVHAAETFTTGASGLSHWRQGNIRRDLVMRLAVPGMLGAMVGAYLLSDIEGRYIRPAISIYLIILGGVILYRAVRPRPPAAPPKNVTFLGLIGGFLDAIGGGGWGPMPWECRQCLRCGRPGPSGWRWWPCQWSPTSPAPTHLSTPTPQKSAGWRQRPPRESGPS